MMMTLTAPTQQKHSTPPARMVMRSPKFGDTSHSAPPPNWSLGGGDLYQTSAATPYPAADSNDTERPGGHKHHYSDIQPLLKAGQVKDVSILVDPKSFTRLPVAEMSLADGRTEKLVLPRDMKAFTATLEQAKVPYTYKSTQHEGAGKLIDWTGSLASEMLGPFALLGGTTLLGMWGMNKFNKLKAEKELKSDIAKAQKDMSGYSFRYQNVAPYHSPLVQAKMNDFLLGITNALVVKGYPGLGKTHILNAMAREVSLKNPNTMILNVSTKVGENVRGLLRDLYGGDKILAPKAMKVLMQRNKGRSVKEILMYADELEHSPDLQGMQELLTKGIGNPSSNHGFELPKLRLLATVNSYPDFLSDEAVASRVSKILVPPPSEGRTLGKILAESLHSDKGKLTLPDQKTLSKALGGVLDKYPGYSPRTLLTNVKTSMLHQVGQKGVSADPKNMAKLLRADLQTRNLNDTELAGLIGQNIVNDAMSMRQALHPEKGPAGLWESLHDSAKAATQEVKGRLSMDGKIAQREIARALKKNDYSLQDPSTVEDLAGNIVRDLKRSRLQALQIPNTTLPPLQRDENKMLGEVTGVINDILKSDDTEAKLGNRKINKVEGEAVRSHLSKMNAALKKLDPKSPAGKDLTQATLLHREMVKEYTDAEHHTFPSPERIKKVIIRALDFNPDKHHEENDFRLIPDEKYGELFMRLNRMLRTVSDDVRVIH